MMGQQRSTKFEILIETAGFLLFVRQKVQATPGIQPFRPEFQNLLTLLAHLILSCGGVNRVQQVRHSLTLLVTSGARSAERVLL